MPLQQKHPPAIREKFWRGAKREGILDQFAINNKYPMNHNDFTPSILQQPSNTHLAFVEPVCPMGWGQVDERLYLHHRCRLQITKWNLWEKPELLHCLPQIFCSAAITEGFLSSLRGQVFLPFLTAQNCAISSSMPLEKDVSQMTFLSFHRKEYTMFYTQLPRAFCHFFKKERSAKRASHSSCK